MKRTTVPPVACVGEPRLTAGFAEFGRLDLAAHEEVHGPVRPLEPAGLLRLAEGIQLKGKGGAGFPFARKVRAVLESCERQDLGAVVVVNATEGEPASWKDKVLLTRAPHLVLDGAALAAYALDAEEIVIGVADDGVGRDSLLEALAERRMPVPASVVTVPHRFISGEGGALVNGINGLPHIPPGTKKRSSDSGVSGLPTLLSNAETYAQLAVAARLGAYEYAALGTDDEPGTVLLTVTGAAGRPAVVECAAGTPLRDILDLCEVPEGPASSPAATTASGSRRRRRTGPRSPARGWPRSAAPSAPASSCRSPPTPARSGRRRRWCATWPASPRDSAGRASGACPTSPGPWTSRSPAASPPTSSAPPPAR